MKFRNSLIFSGVLMFAMGVAQADVVVVVGANSAVGSLSKDQVADIFSGKGGGKVPLDSSNSAIREEFYTKVTGKSAAQMKAFWAQQAFSGKGNPPKSLAGDDEVKKALAADANAVGYIDKSKVDASVKAVFTP